MNICLYGASSPALDRAYLTRRRNSAACWQKRPHARLRRRRAGRYGRCSTRRCGRGRKITGIAPNFLNVDGILFDRCTEFILTDTMAERKAAMIAHADAFVMAPGGFGTLEEFFEVLTLKQLGRHNPAIAILNTNGFYDKLQEFVLSAVEQRFIRSACLNIYALCPTPADTLTYLEQYDPAVLDVRHLKNI